MDKKTCTKCGEEKSYADFKPNKGYADGYHTWCRACLRKHADEWRGKNSEYFLNYKPQAQRNSALYRERHKEVIRAQKLADYHATKDDPVKKANRAAYRKTNRQKLRDMNNRRNAEMKVLVFKHYGDQCICCGATEPVFLTIDHSKNDGAAWRKAFASKMSGGRLYKVIIELGFPEDLQLACWNCNVGRYHNGGTCPHVEMRAALLAA